MLFGGCRAVRWAGGVALLVSCSHLSPRRVLCPDKALYPITGPDCEAGSSSHVAVLARGTGSACRVVVLASAPVGGAASAAIGAVVAVIVGVFAVAVTATPVAAAIAGVAVGAAIAGGSTGVEVVRGTQG